MAKTPRYKFLFQVAVSYMSLEQLADLKEYLLKRYWNAQMKDNPTREEKLEADSLFTELNIVMNILNKKSIEAHEDDDGILS